MRNGLRASIEFEEEDGGFRGEGRKERKRILMEKSRKEEEF